MTNNVDFSVSRRRLVQLIGTGTVAGVAGCSQLGSEGSDRPVSGTVADLHGDAIAGATVQTVITGENTIAETRTDESGYFEISTDRSVWLRVDHPEYIPRLRAVAPGAEVPIRLTVDTETTVSLAFGGDVMFGRRFYETGGDGLSERARIDPGTQAKSHREILQHIQPLLDHADITSVNLETPLTTTDWTYPDKTFQFTSHPAAAGALSNAGVDYVALGNNHVFDALTPGLRETRTALSGAEVAHSGAGLSSTDAWSPAVMNVEETTIEYISCTTVVGAQYDIDWSADRNQSETYTVRQNGQSLTVPGDAGVAEAAESKLSTEISRASERADVVVVQIHGGKEYQRQPTESIRRLTDAAATAGADLVINHHPHVTGGLERRNGALVAWSLGNLVFDQVLWETLRSYVLIAHVNYDGIQRVLAEPVLLDGYVPKGVAGHVRKKLGWDTAARSTGAFSVGSAANTGRVQSSVGTTTAEQTLTGSGSGTVFERNGGGNIELIDSSGTVEFGRDRVYTGSFDEMLVDDEQYGAPLWRFRRRPSATGGDVGRDSGGVNVVSYQDNSRRSILTPVSRIPIEGLSYTVTMWYRSSSRSDIELLVSWYDAASGSSFEQDRFELTATDGEWRQFRTRLAPPDSASFVNLFVFLSPPERYDSHEISVDDLKLIEWTASSSGAMQYHDYIYVENSAAVRMESLDDVGTVEWTEL